ncbi:MAG: Uma2 family endonuclease [Anaerolineae bacterium]
MGEVKTRPGQVEITPSRPPPAKKLTFEEFLAWCDEDTWAEWVDGEVEMLSPASFKHQNLSYFLLSILGFYVEAHDLGIVLSAPFLMRLPGLARGREPDIIFISKGRLGQIHETYLEGPADLVVEITSPESLLRDRGEKFAEYEMAGVGEYWLIDPEGRRADFYLLDEEGRYRREAPDKEGAFHSKVLPGFKLRVAWLWAEPLPTLVEVLRELGVV